MKIPYLIRKRVAKGARLLDEKRPGWWRTITLRDLDLADPNNCVLGQAFEVTARRHLFGGYLVGCERIGIEQADADKFGFAASDESFRGAVRTIDHEYELLRHAWADEVGDRRRAARERLAAAR